MYNLFNTAWIRVRVHFPYFKSRSRRYRKPEKNKEQKWASWSKKKQEEVNHVGADFSKLEYAIDRKLLETPVLELTYHVDVAGSVPDSVAGGFDDRQKGSNVGGLEYLDIGNGDLPPEWAVEVVVQGGSIHYGPWADRQRTQLQRIFFPQAFTHGSSTKRLEPGQTRCCTCLKLLFEFQDVTSLTLPFREASKVVKLIRFLDTPVPWLIFCGRIGNGTDWQVFLEMQSNGRLGLFKFALVTNLL